MGRYDDLEHDSHEDPRIDPPVPEGLASATEAGKEPQPKSVIARMRRKLKEVTDLPWLREDNDALWEGDRLNDE